MPYYVYAIHTDSKLSGFKDLLRITMRRKYAREKGKHSVIPKTVPLSR